MAQFFEEVDHNDDGAFVEIRFNSILPSNHPVYKIIKFINQLDISSLKEKYKVGPGQKGRSPKGIRMMLCVILYAIYCRIYSAHQIDYATYNYSDFWVITHKKRISHDKISDFLNIHEDFIGIMFLETIKLAQNNNLLSFDALYEDGYHIKANASKKKSKNKKKLRSYEKKLEKRLNEILTKLKSNEKEEDDVVKGKKRIEKKLKKIDDLEEELNKRIKSRSFNKLPSEKKALEKNLQINITDKDSELTKMKKGGYENSYTKIDARDAKASIIIASDVSGHYDESHRMRKLTKEANRNVEGLGKYKKVCADSNFNTLGGCVSLESEEIDLISPTKQHESERKNPEKYKDKIKYEYNEEKNHIICSEGKRLNFQSQSAKKRFGSRILKFSNEEACKHCKRKKECTSQKYKVYTMDARHPAQQRTYERYKSEEGQKLYKKRMHVAEVCQGDLKQNGRFIQLLRRGIEKVRVDLMLQDITWNLRRIINTTGDKIVWEM